MGIVMWVIYAFWFCAVGVHLFPYLIPTILVLVVALAVMHILGFLHTGGSPNGGNSGPQSGGSDANGGRTHPRQPRTRGNGDANGHARTGKNGVGRDAPRHGRNGPKPHGK